ncbi:hypothetical protein E5161_11395 [Cohnella pontilimi]|uniref:Fibronectin type-III domain-containing protein n=1 Tax=Cohnella pontilimi TaxID=2564100 RepID=A0A4U0FAX1_9BACL|nr:hypothetical protein [Cohnella pontilimi]TJY41801.1 hypothetical protein E5161_11395 [Cohnella pontilimi]
MKKRAAAKFSFVLSLMLVLQLLLSGVSAFAATSSTMLPPSNLAAQLVTPDDVKLTWSDVYGASGYNVYGITEGQMTLLGTSKTAAYAINNLPEGSYTYVVSTLGPDGESGPCAPVSVNIVYPSMSAPATLTSSIHNGNDIVLNWAASAYAETYKVFQISADGQPTLAGTTAAKTYSVVNAAAGNYIYAVSAVNSLYGESPLSPSTEVTVVTPVMTAPSGLTFSIANTNDLTLKWNAVTYAKGYNVYQIVDGEKVLKGTAASTSVTYNKQPAGDYTYEVHSYSDRFGESAEGSRINVTVSSVTMTPPASFTYKVQNLNDVVFTWTASTNANSYKLYQLVDGQPVLKSTVTGLTTTLTNHPAGDYTYEIRSYSDRFGESAEGTPVSFSIGAVTMAPPTDLSYKLVNGNDIVLTWTAAANANNYKVYQLVNGVKTLKSTVSAATVTFANQPAGDYTYIVTSNSTKFGESADGSQVAFTLVPPVMKPPADVTQKMISATSFSLNWTTSDYATSYKVYQIVNGQKVLKSTVSATTVTYSSMTPGAYTYEVHSVSTRFGESPEGSLLTFTLDGQVMEPPANPTYTITNGNDVKLQWTAAPYATSYKVYQIVNGQEVLKSTVTTTNVSYTNQAAGDYEFVIRSVSAQLGESPEGAYVAFPLVFPVMAAPGSFAYKIQNGNDVVLTWATVPNVNSFKVYELVNGQEILKTTTTSLSVTLTNQPAGEHTYVVHSVSTRFGESPEGSQVSFTLTFPVMQAPANLTKSIANGNDITLNWNAVTYATGYKVYQIVDGQPVLVKTLTGSAVSVTFAKMPFGPYEYRVHSYSDRFGESPLGSTISFTLAEYTMQPPANLTQTITNGNDITLRWTAATYATAYKVYNIVDGEPVLLKTVTTTSAAFVNMPEGDYQFEVHSFSDRFGESEQGSQIGVIIVFPVMQAPAGPAYTLANGNDFTLKWSASSYATNYRIYQVVDGQKVLKKTQTQLNLTYTNMPEGDYRLEVHSYSDRFGESPEAAVISFNLKWPVLLPPALKGSVFNANNITFTWPSAAWANEYRLYEVTGDTRQLLYKGTALTYKVYNLSEDTHRYVVTTYNTRFGESAPSDVYSETIIYPIMQPPVANLKLTGDTSALVYWDFVTYANGYNLYELVDGKPVLVAANINNLSYTLTNLPYADHEYYVTSYSNSFGESEPSNVVLAKLIIDTKPPVTTAVAPAGWSNEPQTVTLTATDDITGVKSTYYSVNDGAYAEGNSIRVEEEGTTKISFYSVDKVGNRETAQTIYVKVDKTAPVTQAKAPSDWAISPVLVLNATDELSGAAKTYYSINGAAYVEGNTVTVTEEGIQKVSFYSVDAAGNKEQAQTVEVKSDRTAPVTESNAPAGWQKETVNVAFRASDAHSGVDQTFFSVNGSTFTEGTSVSLDQEGIHEISFYSVDHSGNKEKTRTVEVKIDHTAPVTTSDAPEGWVNKAVTINLKASDAHSGVAHTFYSVDGTAEVEGTSVTVDQEGIHHISFYSIDAAGNKEEARTVVVKMDGTAPVTESDAPQGWAKDNAAVKLGATDALSGVAHTFYSVDGSKYVEGNTLTIATEGIHTIAYYSADAAGNVEKVKTVTVKVDKSAPVISMDLAGPYKLGTELPLTYKASDDLSGIASEEMTVIVGNSASGTTVTNGGSIKLDKPGVYTVTVTVTNGAGLTTTITRKLEVYILATIEVTPKVINGNNGVFTVRVDLPSGFGTQGFDLNSAHLNGVKALSSNNGYYNQAQNGQFKFERSDFPWSPGEVKLEFRCMLNGYLVIGQTTVTVKK